MLKRLRYGAPHLLPEFLAALPALRRWPVRRVLAKQLYFSGIESLGMVALIAMAVGGIIVGQLHFQFGQSGQGALKLLASITLSELAPLVTGFLLVARSCSAMASELATMQAGGEIRNLYRMGVPPVPYLVVPRVIGMSISAAALTIYFALIAILTGALAVGGMNTNIELEALLDGLTLAILPICMIKGMAMGCAISLVACAQGLSGPPLTTEIPRAASRAVLRGTIALFGVDLLFVLMARLI
ncbi:ABC transporter permease [Parachitinimonas caeni]|uniref:ABC transporter permease n=1 Tax=Parachitinimonas caeni TaxID=3031301 RepID=A0ABT7DX16_9NEIS|nr:ABC transporter permease [Parachitinimonas caeni]MDK2124611.1 ABC transporter permease [Parachitinimonas caeni]